MLASCSEIIRDAAGVVGERVLRLDHGRDRVFSERLGLLNYSVLAPEEAKMASWCARIDEIFADLKANGFANYSSCVRNMSLSVIMSKKDRSDETLRLLSIGNFVLMEKAPWEPIEFSLLKAIVKILGGGCFPIENTLREDGNAICIDLAVVVKVLAERYGIHGKICRDRCHYYFESVSGVVIDVLFGKYKPVGLSD